MTKMRTALLFFSFAATTICSGGEYRNYYIDYSYPSTDSPGPFECKLIPLPPIIKAIDEYDFVKFKALISQDAKNVNAVWFGPKKYLGQYITTPLFRAIGSFHKQINQEFIRELVLHGANIHFKDLSGNNSLQTAIAVGAAKALFNAIEERIRRNYYSLSWRRSKPDDVFRQTTEPIAKKEFAQEIYNLLNHKNNSGLNAIEEAQKTHRLTTQSAGLVDYLMKAQRFCERYK